MFNNKYLSLLIIVFITFLASAIGGVVTSSYKEPWYSQIVQPSFSPPSWVFGPVDNIVYFNVSSYLDKLDYKKQPKTLKIYFIHIFLTRYGA